MANSSPNRMPSVPLLPHSWFLFIFSCWHSSLSLDSRLFLWFRHYHYLYCHRSLCHCLPSPFLLCWVIQFMLYLVFFFLIGFCFAFNCCCFASFFVCIFLFLCRAGYMLYLIERSKKCLDFSATLFIIHLFICIIYGGWPSSITWWIVNGTGFAVMARLGKYLCSSRELREIPISRYRSSKKSLHMLNKLLKKNLICEMPLCFISFSSFHRVVCAFGE